MKSLRRSVVCSRPAAARLRACGLRRIEIGLPTAGGRIAGRDHAAGRRRPRCGDRDARRRRRDRALRADRPGELVGSLPVPAPGAHQHQRARAGTRCLPGVDVPITTGRLLRRAGVGAGAGLESNPPRARRCRARGPGCASASRRRCRRPRSTASASRSSATARRSTRSAHALADGTLVLNPTPELPAGGELSRGVARRRRRRRRERVHGRGRRRRRRGDRALRPHRSARARAVPRRLLHGRRRRRRRAASRSTCRCRRSRRPFQAQAFTALVAQTYGVDGWSRMTPSCSRSRIRSIRRWCRRTRPRRWIRWRRSR